MSERAKIVRVGDAAGFYLHTPYDVDFVAELKKLVPGPRRSWSDAETRWFVAGEYEEQVAQLCVVHFRTVEIWSEEGGLDEVMDRAGRAVQERLL